jgi:phosphinothricin acetyltransferase
MPQTQITVRQVEPRDAAAIATIYAHHVQHGTATFDTEAPGTDWWVDKIAAIQARSWPFLVAEIDGSACGYAYATQFRDRAAYAESCENSIYVTPDRLGMGIGTVLLGALLTSARDAGFRQMIAVVGGAEPASVALHVHCGFEHAGRLRNVGRKFGRLLDTVYLQRSLT